MRASVLRLGLATTGVIALVAGAVVVGGPAQASGRHDERTKTVTVKGGPGSGEDVVIGCTMVSVDAEDTSAPVPGTPQELGRLVARGKAVAGGKTVTGTVVGGKVVTGTVKAGKVVRGKVSRTGDVVAVAVPAPKGAKDVGGGATGSEVAPQPVAGDGSVDLDGSFVVEVPEGLDCSAA